MYFNLYKKTLLAPLANIFHGMTTLKCFHHPWKPCAIVVVLWIILRGGMSSINYTKTLGIPSLIEACIISMALFSIGILTHTIASHTSCTLTHTQLKYPQLLETRLYFMLV